MVKVTLENREAFQAIEDRLNNAVSDFVEKPNSWLQGSQKKVIRGKLAQITTCFLQKIKRNTRLMDDEWSDGEDEPDAKRTKKERLEPEDLVLKSRVEDLRRKVQDAARRVKAHRQTAPSKIQEAVKENLDLVNANFEQAIAAADQPSKMQAPSKPDLSISAASRKAFVEDASDMATRVASLSKELPQQLAKGRTTVRACKEWMGKPLTGADAVMADSKSADSAARGTYARQAKMASALRARQ